MTVHSTAFEAGQPARPIPAAAAVLAADPIAFVAAAAPAAARKLNFRKLLSTAAALAVMAGAAWVGWDYWTVGQYLVSTDDAYVRADSTTIAPKVAGYLLQVLVKDNERVRTGQVLARIDDRDFKVALDQATADVAAARATIASKQAQLDVQQAVINAAKATLDVDRAVVTFAAQENKRYTDLAGTGYGSVQNAQQAQSRNASASATLMRDEANLASAEKQVDLLKAEIVQAGAALARAQALQHQAELNLGYTTITAPIDGVVGNRTLRVGQFVQAGTQLMSVVPAAAPMWWRTTRRPSSPTCMRARPSRSRSTCSRARSCTATSTASHPPAARNSRCCRRTTPPAISPRWCSVSRSGSRSTAAAVRSSCGRACR